MSFVDRGVAIPVGVVSIVGFGALPKPRLNLA
jgi:hypothetical protein